MSNTLDTFVSVPIPSALYLELANRYPGRVATLIESQLEDFLERTSEAAVSMLTAKKGAQWESLFLPDGTEIRTQYYGVMQSAAIRGEDIVWNDRVYRSMSRLAGAMRGNTSNNAWKVLEVKRPTDSAWQLADRLRG